MHGLRALALLGLCSLQLAACDKHLARPPAEDIPKPPPMPQSPETARAQPSASAAPVAPTTQAQPVLVADPASLEAAMLGFARAIDERDVDSFLSYISKKKGFRYVGTIQHPHKVDQVAYKVVARDLQNRDDTQGWYSVLMSNEDESLALSVAGAAGRPWKKAGKLKFVLPDDDLDSTLYVTWRKEESRWVIDSIGIPAS
jgi:hypothetical protein